MRTAALVLAVLFFAVASVGGGLSTFGQTFVVSGDSSTIAITGRLDVIESQTAALQRDVRELKELVVALQAGQKPEVQPVKITIPEPKPVVAALRSSAELSAEQHLRTTHGINVSGLSLTEMESIHDRAHGGTAYHFPGMASISTIQPASQVVRYSSSNTSNCPGGRCPTRTTSRFRFFRR